MSSVYADGLPDGCTAAMVEAAWGRDMTPDEQNEREAAIEEQARAEIERCDVRFFEWLLHNADAADSIVDLARFFSASLQLGEKTGQQQVSYWTLQGQIVADYQAHRVAEES